jgi:hypothetical protein
MAHLHWLHVVQDAKERHEHCHVRHDSEAVPVFCNKMLLWIVEACALGSWRRPEQQKGDSYLRLLKTQRSCGSGEISGTIAM